MKVAIVHYWLVRMRGGEKVLEAICELYPDADIFTHVVNPAKISETINNHAINTTFINSLPWSRTHYQNYLPLMPIALEQLDLSEYDLIISSESGPAKGVITRPDAVHICYCHTPMRYVWDMYHEYLNRQNIFKRLLMRPLLHYVRGWDFRSAARVDHFISNSNYVAQRVKKFYRRESTVIYPPVDVDKLRPVLNGKEDAQDYYLLLGQLVRYKKADIAIRAFNELGKKLIVIGTGDHLRELKKLANNNIEFLGWQNEEHIAFYLRSCRALIFPGIEDFGIVPLEAMASGTPVIAYAKGGALETVVDQTTGILFDEQSAAGLSRAVIRFETLETQFDKETLVRYADGFSKSRFKREMNDFINNKLGQSGQ